MTRSLPLALLLPLFLASPASAQLYGIDLQNDQVLAIDPATGAATVAGPLGFDTNATAADFAPDGTLWMLARSVATGEDALYTVDLATGAATQVVTVDFGGGHGIAFSPDGSILYAIDNPDLVTIDTGTGAVSTVGNMGIGSNAPSLTKGPSGTLYTVVNATHELYEVDPSTGTASLVGSLGVTGSFASVTYDWGNGRLLTVHTGGTLYSLDPSTGAASLIGSLGVSSTVAGLAYRNDAPVPVRNCGWGELKTRFPGR